MSQWLVSGLGAAQLPVICVETRHMKVVLKALQTNKSDRNDARGITQMMRVQVARRRGMSKAIMAAARRLAVILHRMWLDGTEFRWRKQADATGA